MLFVYRLIYSPGRCLCINMKFMCVCHLVARVDVSLPLQGPTWMDEPVCTLLSSVHFRVTVVTSCVSLVTRLHNDFHTKMIYQWIRKWNLFSDLIRFSTLLFILPFSRFFVNILVIFWKRKNFSPFPFFILRVRMWLSKWFITPCWE